MTVKLVSLLLACLLLSQVSKGDERNIQNPVADIIELIKTTLLTINSFISDLIKSARFQVTEIIRSLDSTRKIINQIADDIVEKEFRILNHYIDQFKNSSNAPGAIILQCIENSEGEAGQVRKDFINATLDCVDSAINIYLNDTFEIIDSMQELNGEFRVEEERLKNCEDKLIPIDCIKDIVVDVSKTALKIPVKIREEISKIIKEFHSVEKDLFHCTGKITSDLQQRIGEVFNYFAQCVNDQATTPYN